MGRKTHDRLLAAGGLVVAAVLLIASALLYWAHSFVDHEVHTQLAAQKIYFPPKGSESLADPQVKPYLEQYAGKQLVNGTQAHAYADHFIAVHVAKIGGGKTYAQLSSEAQANPNDSELAGKVQTVFRGFFFSSRRRHTRSLRDWSSDVCSSDLPRQSDVMIVAGTVTYKMALAV